MQEIMLRFVRVCMGKQNFTHIFPHLINFNRQLLGIQRALILSKTIIPNTCCSLFTVDRKKTCPYFFMSLLWSILSFFLSLLARDAVNPRSSTASMMSRGPVISVSYTNRPLLVAKATEACKIPGLLIMEDSIRCTQEEHVIPLIWSKNEKIKIWIVSFKITHHYMSYYTVLYFTILYYTILYYQDQFKRIKMTVTQSIGTSCFHCSSVYKPSILTDSIKTRLICQCLVARAEGSES